MAKDWFARAFGAAVEDVRHRFEEVVYGRVVTSDRDPARSPSEQLGWERPTAPDHRPPAAAHDPDLGIDR